MGIPLGALGKLKAQLVEPTKFVPLKLVMAGQIRGGKNNMLVLRSGRHIPKPEWQRWRDNSVMGIREQLPRGFKAMTQPIDIKLTYVAGDRRRRDMPAILDSIWHVLEKAGVVSDDTQLWVRESDRSYDKSSPRAEIEFLEVVK